MDSTNSSQTEILFESAGEDAQLESGNITTSQTTPESGGTPILEAQEGETPASTTGITTPTDKDLSIQTDINDAIDAITVTESKIPAVEIETSLQTAITETPSPSSDTTTNTAEPNPTEETTTKPAIADNTTTSNKSKRAKPRIVRTTHHGIYTIKHLESANFFVEWYRGLLISSPYMFRLLKTFYSLSPTRASLLIATNLIKAVLPSIQIWVTKQFLDQVQKASLKVEDGGKVARNIRGLVVLGLLRVGTRMGGQVLEMISDKVGGVMETRLARELDFKLMDAYLRLDSSQLDKTNIRDLFQKAQGFVNYHPSNMIMRWLKLARCIITIISSGYTLSRLLSKEANRLAILNLVKLCVSLYTLFKDYSSYRQVDIANQDYHRYNRMRKFATKTYLRPHIKALGLEAWLLSQYSTAFKNLGDTSIKGPWDDTANSLTYVFFQLMMDLISSAEYAWLIYEGLSKGVTLGTLQLISWTVNDMCNGMWELSSVGWSAANGWRRIIGYYKCLELKSEIKDPVVPKEYISTPAGMKIEARGLKYKYEEKDTVEVLKGTSFVINPGEMIAVVGYNGAGKSTLARLLTRLANPTEGDLLINDIDVKEYDPAVLRKHITVLFQTSGEFSGLTIGENIGVGNISQISSTPSIHSAAVESGAHDFISALPFKYDTYLSCIPGWTTYTEGFSKWDASSDVESDSENEDELKKEQGKKVQKDLSGGQWQKLGLARAFMRSKEADLMVLDEPTANLDPEAEFKLFETIKRARKGRTTVFISHRFNTVRIADRIMVLDRGVVKEFGTHEELMGVEVGQYRRFYEVQAKGFVIEGDKDGK